MDPNLIGHLANLLFAASYLVRDILWLRAISVFACGAAIIFNIQAPESPLWVAVYWNIFFIVVNCLQIFRIVQERNRVALTTEENEIYRAFFSRLSPFEFFKLVRAGKWVEYAVDDELVRQGEAVTQVHLIYNGEAIVRAGSDPIATLRDGSFVGEAGYVSGETASASVAAGTPLRCVVWPTTNLHRLFHRSPTLESSFFSAIGVDLARKLRGVAPQELPRLATG